MQIRSRSVHRALALAMAALLTSPAWAQSPATQPQSDAASCALAGAERAAVLAQPLDTFDADPTRGWARAVA